MVSELDCNDTVFQSNLTGKRMLKRILQQIYPCSCVLCGDARLVDKALCDACELDLRVNQHACERCAIPMVSQQKARVCGECLKKSPLQDTSFSAFIYAQPLEWMIQQLKFSGKLNYAPLLANVMKPYLPALDLQPDCIIPVPLHKKKLRQRGFNQTHELIKPIAAELAIPIDIKHCLRNKYTEAQTGLNAESRRKNIKSAFEFDNVDDYQYVIVFDDVITTGSTVHELVKTIKKQGVKRVDVWSLARADKIF